MRPVIERATPAHLDELLGLIRDFYVVDRHEFVLETVLGGLRPLLDDDTYGQVWLITDPDDPGTAAGYAVVTWSWSLESGGRDCILDEIFVRRQGAGLGGPAIRAVVAEAARAGAKVVALETEAHNERARTFYAREGFTLEDSVWMLRPTA